MEMYIIKRWHTKPSGLERQRFVVIYWGIWTEIQGTNTKTKAREAESHSQTRQRERVCHDLSVQLAILVKKTNLMYFKGLYVPVSMRTSNEWNHPCVSRLNSKSTFPWTVSLTHPLQEKTKQFLNYHHSDFGRFSSLIVLLDHTEVRNKVSWL